MKNIITAGLLLIASTAFSGDFSVKPGLDLASFGGVLVHDFAADATISALNWDGAHFQYKGDDFAEAGLFAGKRDVDNGIIVGPSLGSPGATLGETASFLMDRGLSWKILPIMKDYGQYAKAYLNLGWDFAHPNQMHGKPSVIGLGVQIKK